MDKYQEFRKRISKDIITAARTNGKLRTSKLVEGTTIMERQIEENIVENERQMNLGRRRLDTEDFRVEDISRE